MLGSEDENPMKIERASRVLARFQAEVTAAHRGGEEDGKEPTTLYSIFEKLIIF